MQRIDEFALDTSAAKIFEHGWQSWSPTTTYSPGDRPWRPVSEENRLLHYRAETSPGSDVYEGEGLLAIDPGEGSGVRIYAALDHSATIPSIRAELIDGTVAVSADGPVDCIVDNGPGSLDNALARWADGFAQRAGVTQIRKAPTIWCSWYHYFTNVTEADMIENIEAIDNLDLPVDVIQLDDGYQTAHGDWLTLADRFASLERIAGRVAATGRRAGIWVAPFLVFPDSDLAREHPDWLIGGADAPIHAAHSWNRDLYALDTTHPGAMGWITEVFSTMHSWGYDFFKIDFIFAGALTGKRYRDVAPIAAYRDALGSIRNAIGDSYLLGCGAPILPSVGLVDAMRISPDTAPSYLPEGGDMCKPGIASAILTGRGRAFQQGRFWINDADDLIARPEVERREEWADHVGRFSGLRGSSDRIAALDEWGLETTRRLLSESPTEPFIPSRGQT